MPRILSLLLASVLLAPVASAQGLLHARLTVFGMDCAPCAYGIEKGLLALPGVEDVKVSLNDGYTEVTLAPDAKTSLADIRQVVLDNGFTPKAATVRLEGTVRPGSPPTLTAGSATYPLEFDGVQSVAPAARRVRLTGEVAPGESLVRVVGLERLSDAMQSGKR